MLGLSSSLTVSLFLLVQLMLLIFTDFVQISGKDLARLVTDPQLEAVTGKYFDGANENLLFRRFLQP
ncbi:MAG: hypothetical protein ABIP06_09155 [Pyrinomonadaceae bacterium]